jgi:hypothetical protein
MKLVQLLFGMNYAGDDVVSFNRYMNTYSHIQLETKE